MAAWLSVSSSPIYAPFFRIPLSTHHAIPRSEDGVSGETRAHFGASEFSRRKTDVEALCSPCSSDRTSNSCWSVRRSFCSVRPSCIGSRSSNQTSKSSLHMRMTS